MNVVSALRILALFALVFTPRAEACSCMVDKGTRAEQVLEALNDSGVVFVARLRSTTHTPHEQYSKKTRCSARRSFRKTG